MLVCRTHCVDLLKKQAPLEKPLQRGQGWKNLFCQFSNDDKDGTLSNYLMFDHNLSTSVGQINTDLEDWRERAKEEAIRDILIEQGAAKISSSDNVNLF